MAFDEFVGILKAFELSKAYEAKGMKKKEDEVKKEIDVGAALKVSKTEDSLAMLSRQFAKYLKQKGKEKKNIIDEEKRSSSKNLQCFECKGYGHVRSECANLHKQTKKVMNVVTSDSETDSDEEEEDLKNFVALINFRSETASDSETVTEHETVTEPATATEPATTIAKSETTAVHESESNSDAESIDDEEFAVNYKMLYEHWLKLVEDNSVLTKQKLKLEAKVVDLQKYATEKEEEASQAKVQLEETQKNLRMLNNGTEKLDHILNIWKTDRHGLGFKAKISKSDPVFVYSGKIMSASGTVTETAIEAKTASDTRSNTETATATRNIQELRSAPRRAFQPVCHHCGVVGHIRPRCFRLIRERNQMENTYDVRFRVRTCYHCGVQGHIKRNYFRFIRESSHEGKRHKKIWVRKDDFYGYGALGYQPRIAKRGEFFN